MEQAILDGIKSAPSLTALVIVVFLFIRSQQWMIKNNETVSKERVSLFSVAIKDMHEQHMEARHRAHDQADKATVANLQLAQIMARVEQALLEANHNHKHI